MPETAREKDSSASPFLSCSGERKNKYIKMPAGKMKIQTNALIRDAEALLENVSRCWLLLLGASSYTQLPVQDEAVEVDWGERGEEGESVEKGVYVRLCCRVFGNIF